jgi:hypothetical protein
MISATTSRAGRPSARALRGDAVHSAGPLGNLDPWIGQPVPFFDELAGRIENTDVGRHDSTGFDVNSRRFKIENAESVEPGVAH